MLAIQNQKTVTQEITLWRKRRQSKTKTANPVKFAKSKSRTNSYAESAKAKPM